ncbi:MAG: hypothetical protein M3301_04130 [Chloroflexota bacterium]|nr:hypothetical protein [Chloroflexota bacterium]
MVVYRLNPNGTPDTTFDTDGAAGIDSGGNEFGYALALRPDGKIVVTGEIASGNVVVYRLKANGGPGPVNGALDPTFDTDGGAGLDSGGGELGWDVALRPDGKIVIGGTTSNGVGGGDDVVVYRLNENGGPGPLNGALDTSFDGDGAAGVHGGGTDGLNELILRPDGKIVVAAATGSPIDGFHGAIYRLNENGGPGATNGALDTTFDTDGAVTIDNGVDENRINAIALQPDGRIVAAGASGPIGNIEVAVYRLKADGGSGAPNDFLDPTFDGDGKVLVDAGSAHDAGRGVALLPDRRIVVGGDVSDGQDTLLLRLFGDPFTLSVQKAGGGSGSVASSPAGIACAPTCSSPFDAGTPVTLTPAADAGSVFTGWSGPHCSDTGSCVVTIAADTSVTARFDKQAPAGSARCAGRRATKVGTSGADRLRGTRRRDVIAGLGGNDVVSGLGGNDLICGGRGKDRLTGGAGRDQLRGDSGNDKLRGGTGRDRLLGGSGRDQLHGDSGNDRLLGGSGRDRLLGGRGRDRLVGGAGRDREVQ